MKYLGLIPLFLLAGCQSTPTFCEKEPESNLCDPKTYLYDTEQALKEFEKKKSKKAFALGKLKMDGSFMATLKVIVQKGKLVKLPLKNVKKDWINTDLKKNVKLFVSKT